jgi:hypothetical protein
MSTPFDTFALTNLEGAGGFTFIHFPSGIETSARANWQPQEVTIGTKPLFYANREPRQIRVDDLLLDNTMTGDSVTPDIQALFRLMEELENKGRPPALLARWGDREERCVLTELNVSEQFFLLDGTPIRARISITLLQFQDEPSINRGQPAPAPLNYKTTDGQIVAAGDSNTPSGQVSGGRVIGPQP